MSKKLPIFMILLLFIIFSPVTVSNAKTLDKLPLKSGSYNWSKAKSYYVQYTTAKPTNKNATAINLPTKVKGYNGDFYIKIDKKFHMISKASSKTYTLPNNMNAAKIFYVPKGTKKCTAYFYVRRIRWAGHRGSDIDMYNARTSKPYCKLNRTPNSKASFDHAVQKGAFTIETDLYLTGDKNVDYVNGKLNPTLRHYYNDKFDPNYRFLQFQNTCRGKSYMMLDLKTDKWTTDKIKELVNQVNVPCIILVRDKAIINSLNKNPGFANQMKNSNKNVKNFYIDTATLKKFGFSKAPAGVDTDYSKLFESSKKNGNLIWSNCPPISDSNELVGKLYVTNYDKNTTAGKEFFPTMYSDKKINITLK